MRRSSSSRQREGINEWSPELTHSRHPLPQCVFFVSLKKSLLSIHSVFFIFILMCRVLLVNRKKEERRGLFHIITSRREGTCAVRGAPFSIGFNTSQQPPLNPSCLILDLSVQHTILTALFTSTLSLIYFFCVNISATSVPSERCSPCCSIFGQKSSHS